MCKHQENMLLFMLFKLNAKYNRLHKVAAFTLFGSPYWSSQNYFSKVSPKHHRVTSNRCSGTKQFIAEWNLDDKIEHFFSTSSTTYIHVRNSVSLMTKCVKLSQFCCIYWSLELLCDDWLLTEYWDKRELNCAANVKITSLMVAHAAL